MDDVTPIERIRGWPGRRSSTTSPVSGGPSSRQLQRSRTSLSMWLTSDPAFGAITREIDDRLGRGRAGMNAAIATKARAVIRKHGGIMDIPLSSANSSIRMIATRAFRTENRYSQMDAD